MPAATTHLEFAREVYDALNTKFKREITDEKMFYFGSQGPDILFFAKFGILPGNMMQVGELMHDSSVKEVNEIFARFANKSSAIHSYYCGYLCHYALDSVVHPLVNAKASEESERTGRTSSEVHFRIESEYDLYILEKLGRHYSDYDVYKYLRPSNPDLEKLAVVYSYMLKRVYNLDYSKRKLISAFKDVSRMTRMLKPGRRKMAFASKAEDIFRAPKMISGMMLSNKRYTALNQERSPWSPVFDSQAVYTDSFEDLYQKAKKLAVQLIEYPEPEDFILNFVGEPYESDTNKTD